MKAECPAGCGRVQPAGKFLCRTCWFAVPKELRDDLMRAWRAYSKAARTGADDFMQKSRAYRAARDACLASL